MHAHAPGLAHDLNTLLRRRRALQWLGALGTAAAGCGSAGVVSAASGNASATALSCSVVPRETAGPFPGNGSNSANGHVANALALAGIVRSDIRTSVAGASGVATGVPLKLAIRLVDAGGGGCCCAALPRHAIYVWHCDAQGRYSMYSAGVTGENYLRGVQFTDAQGEASFQTVYPGCYGGRMPHVHFEVYRGGAAAPSLGSRLRTSQLALPSEASTAVYADHRYAESARNFEGMSFAMDGVFSDGVAQQMLSITGSAAQGLVATITVGIPG